MAEKKKAAEYKHGHYDNIGHYEHRIEVFLDSKHALRLVGGRKADPLASEAWAKHEVIGLVKYAPAAIRLYRMAYSDNPYVDEALLMLEDRIEEAESFFKEKILLLQEKLSVLPSNTGYKLVQSSKPFHLNPNFGGNPYANKGVIILALYDQMMTLMETCRSFGLIKRKEAKDLEYHGGRVVRRVYVAPGEFKPCEITREEYRLGAEKAQLLISSRGPVRIEVLNKTLVPEFGPVSNEVDTLEIDEIMKALTFAEAES